MGAFATLGLTIAFIIASFVGLGIWADRRVGTSPWCLLVGIAFGSVAAVVSVVS